MSRTECIKSYLDGFSEEQLSPCKHLASCSVWKSGHRQLKESAWVKREGCWRGEFIHWTAKCIKWQTSTSRKIWAKSLSPPHMLKRFAYPVANLEKPEHWGWHSSLSKGQSSTLVLLYLLKSSPSFNIQAEHITWWRGKKKIMSLLQQREKAGTQDNERNWTVTLGA